MKPIMNGLWDSAALAAMAPTFKKRLRDMERNSINAGGAVQTRLVPTQAGPSAEGRTTCTFNRARSDTAAPSSSGVASPHGGAPDLQGLQ